MNKQRTDPLTLDEQTNWLERAKRDLQATQDECAMFQRMGKTGYANLLMTQVRTLQREIAMCEAWLGAVTNVKVHS